MKLRLVPFVLSFCLLSQVHATTTEAEQRNWMMSGSELLANLSANQGSQKLFSDPGLLNAQAQGYIVAIMDSEDWCQKGQILPHEVYDRVFTHISALDEEAQAANASEFVKEALQSFCES